jgi:uncharacterized protein YbaP (TraB family)
MNITNLKRTIFFVLLCSFVFYKATAQSPKPEKKYPSLLWEITGNGLKKPSYLFGTMHVSNKMVFHLSDSFFLSIKKADVVGLELNSETWQTEMTTVEKQKESFYKFYGSGYRSDFSNNLGKYGADGGIYGSIGLKDYTFRINNQYLELIKFALQETPYVINSLLYRTKDYRQDFEENTFLDMYIFQTGKKLGKKSAGMETIFTMEKYTTEAEIDRANEKVKKKKKVSYDDYPEMTPDEAYRKGDLDMLDSLDRMNMESEAFIEKFLYQRNDVQANSMDTIMKKGQSLFVGVGAAHLPGKRGVIEILRRKGYNLRPIKMIDRDGKQRDAIDKIRVPVKFVENIASDGFYKVQVPGKLYDRQDGFNGFSRQYADMSNGAYYMVTRVPTVTSLFGITNAMVLQKIDSLLYENVPGKIIKKTNITRNGYTGLDVINKTRRGDIQRYHIFVAPNEVFIFKMSGNENYVQGGTEATQFFNSIQLKEQKVNWLSYKSKEGNYIANLPHEPYTTGLKYNSLIDVANDEGKKINYLIQRKIFPNTDVTVHDTFNLMLMEESFIGSKKKLQTLKRVFTQEDHSTILSADYRLVDTFLQVKYMIKGPQYYVVSATGTNKNEVLNNKVLPSFKIIPFATTFSNLYVDTFLNFSVKTPHIPQVIDSLKALLYKLNNTDRYSYGNKKDIEYSSFGKSGDMTFVNDTTGEKVTVRFVQSGKYEFAEDSIRKQRQYIDSLSKYVKNATALAKVFDSIDAVNYPKYYENNSIYKKYIVKQNELEKINDHWVRKISYTDTGSTTLYKSLSIAKDNYYFDLEAATDISNSSTFINQFFETFTPSNKIKDVVNLNNKIDSFFTDYYSIDSTKRKLARSAIKIFNFKKKDWSRMMTAFHQLSSKDKDYFSTKLKWIDAIANIDDSTLRSEKLTFLKNVYEKTMDSSIFQNNILNNLINLKTKESYALFKQYLLQDPPVTTSNYGYDYGYDYDNSSNINFFSKNDSLELVETLFPEVLQLTSIPEYEKDIVNTLITLVDSNKIASKDYEGYSTKVLFDAKIELKKKLVEQEKLAKKEFEKDPDEEDETGTTYNSSYNSTSSNMMDYITLLLPFYEKNSAVPNLINKIWQLKDDKLKENLLFKMIEKGKSYPDTLINYFANKEEYRGYLYYRLHKLKQGDLFPVKYNKQATMATAFLYTSFDYIDQMDSIDIKGNDDYEKYIPPRYDYGLSYPSAGASYGDATKKMDSIALIRVDTFAVEKKKGLIYIYKYKKEKEDKWRFAISGLQPLDGKGISYKNFFTKLYTDKINEEESLEEQIAMMLKRLRFEQNPNSSNFFTTQNKYGGGDYQYD